ncbi:MAG: hypothetical protein RIQ81_2502 [Pseudomonadota bacterium]|jgi:hypothetical protein
MARAPSNHLHTILAIFVGATACGKKPAVETNRVVDRSADAVVTDFEKPGTGSISLGNPGLPASCKEIVDPDMGRDDLFSVLQQLISPSRTRKACFECQPSKLVRIKCLDIDKGELADVCGHKQENGANVIGCKSGEKISKFNLAPSRVEKVVELLPLMTSLFGPAIVEKFPEATKPVERLVAEKSIIFARDFLAPVVYGERIPEAAATITGIAADIRAKQAKPQLSDEAKADIQETALSALRGIAKAAQRQDSMTPEFLGSIVDPISAKAPELAALKPALAVLFSNLETNDLLPILLQALSQDNGASLAGILAGLGGSGSVNP